MDSVDIVAIIGASQAFLVASLIAIRMVQHDLCITIMCCGLECHREVQDARA